MYDSKIGFYPLRLDPSNSSAIFDLTAPKDQSMPNKIFNDIQTPLGATNMEVEPIESKIPSLKKSDLVVINDSKSFRSLIS